MNAASNKQVQVNSYFTNTMTYLLYQIKHCCVCSMNYIYLEFCVRWRSTYAHIPQCDVCRVPVYNVLFVCSVTCILYITYHYIVYTHF